MKKYVKEAVKELQSSGKRKTEITLKSARDYKKNVFRLLYNKIVMAAQMKIIPAHIKNLLLRTTGMNVGHDACVPHDIYFDPYFPELIYLGKGCIVGGESNIRTHRIEGNKLILGKCALGERTLMGGCSTMEPGSAISRNSILRFFSELKDVIPEGELWGGKPAKLITKFSSEDIEKFFRPSNMQYREYYREFKRKVKEFLSDPGQTYLKIYYNGKRLNAGDDWWRARNVLRIFYNGIMIEATRRLPNCLLKTLLLRMAGTKIGRNCRIGKGVVFDHIYCDTITLEDDVTIDGDCYLDGHEYTITQTVFGRILIKKGAHLKHHSFVRTGATIGENAVIEPYTAAQRDIPPNEVWAGTPARFKRRI